MLHQRERIARKLDEVVTLEELLRLGQVRVRVFFHDSRLAVVMRRVGVKVAKVLCHIFSLPQVPHIGSNFGILVHKLGIHGVGVTLVNLV